MINLVVSWYHPHREKDLKDDIKVTDLLYQAYNAKDNKTFEETFKLIKARYQDIIDELKLNCSLEKEI